MVLPLCPPSPPRWPGGGSFRFRALRKCRGQLEAPLVSTSSDWTRVSTAAGRIQ